MRFSSKGSLSVVCSGAKAGQFYDFENQEGGGPLKLIQRQLGLGSAEAKEWAKNFLGVTQDIKVPKIFTSPSPAHKDKDSQWVSLIPSPEAPAPGLEELCHKKLCNYFEEVARHPYRDEHGQLLSSALQKGMDPQQVLYRCTSTYSGDPEAKARANEILWRVDERLRDELEKRFAGQTWKINEEILAQTCRILMPDTKREELISKMHCGADISKRLLWQVTIFQAQHGKMPTELEIGKMRTVIGNLRDKVGKAENDFAIDYAITKGCQQSLGDQKIDTHRPDYLHSVEKLPEQPQKVPNMEL